MGGFFSSFGFFRRRRRSFFFFFKRDSSGSNRAHPHTHLVFLFSFLVCVPARIWVYLPFLAVRPFLLAFCRGAILGPGRFSDSLGTSLMPFSRTRGGMGASLLLVLVLLFPFFVLFCGFTPFLEARVGFLAEVGSPSRLFQPKWAERVVRARPSGE